MKHKIEMNFSYRTEDGREVRLFTTTGGDKIYPVVGEIRSKDDPDMWITMNWTVFGETGKGFDNLSTCLIKCGEKNVLRGFVNVLPEYSSLPSRAEIFNDALSAKVYGRVERIACVDLSKFNVEYLPGEGL